MPEVDLDRLRAALDEAERRIRACSPSPWAYNSYSVILSCPKMSGHDQWQDEQFAAGHTLERRGACPACPGQLRCALYTEDYRRDPLVAKVPSHHGDTAIGHAAADAEHIERWQPSTALRLVERDRQLLADHDRQIEHLGIGDDIEEVAACVACSDLTAGVIAWPCREVERVAAFWLGASVRT